MKIWKLVPQSNELLHLDFLRFLASAAIVYHHSHEFFYPKEIRAAATAGSHSLALFVDLFFLISGFVISYVYFERMSSLRAYSNFMLKRVFRLVPLHWVTLLVSIFIWAALSQFGKAGHGPSFSPVCIANTAFLLHAVFECGDNLNFNGASWSISAEMCAYAVFPILVLLAMTNRLLPLLLTAVCFVGVVWLSGVPANTLVWDAINPVVRAITSFSFGLWLYIERDKIGKIPAASFLVLIAFAILVLGMLNDVPTLLSMIMVYVVGILGTAADMQKRESLLVRRVAPLGQLTYSIYMWHGIFILVMMNALGDKILHLSGWKAVILGLVTYAAIMIGSYLSFTIIETPARRWLEQSTRRRTVSPMGG